MQQDAVYLVTQEDLSAGRPTLEIVEQAIRGGVDVIQLREKDCPARTRYTLGHDILELVDGTDVTFIVNDRIDIARAIGADGVHLGDEDLPIRIAREQLGADAIIGRSVSTTEDAQAAEAAGADYLGVGSIYTTDSKDTDPAETDIGLETITAIRRHVDIPIYAIGGITTENAADVAAAGATGVAVITAITMADDPAEATQQLSAAVKKGRDDQ